MRELERDLERLFNGVSRNEEPSFSFEDVWAKHEQNRARPETYLRPRKWVTGTIVTVAGLCVAAVLIFIVMTPLQRHGGVSTAGLSSAHNAALQNDIFQERGFQITSQQQNIVAQFTIQPDWIPSQPGAKNDIHQVFYRGHHTELYVDYVWRTNDGNVEVVLNGTSTYSPNGGSFVTPQMVVKKSQSPDEYTMIPWLTGLTKTQVPRFTNANTHQQFTLNIGGGAGPDDELMFSIRSQDVAKYFKTPVTVTIPDYNLITYQRLGSVSKNRALYNPKLGWIEFSGTNGTDYYVVTNQPCTPADPMGTVGPNHGLGPGQVLANVLPSGTELYRISGVDPQQAVCVALDYGNGGYVKAVYAGPLPPA